MPAPKSYNIKLQPSYNSEGTQTGAKLIANMPLAAYLKLNLPSKESLIKPKYPPSRKK